MASTKAYPLGQRKYSRDGCSSVPTKRLMNLRDCYIEEDLFPKIFTDYEEREY